MPLGDFFPEDLKKEFVDRNIDIGKAILMHVPGFDVTYDKYVILIAPSVVDNYFGYVVINTRINENVNRSTHLQQQHVLIDCLRHEFLKHDSYVDCSDIKQETVEAIRECIQRKPDCVCGNVEEDIIKLVHEKLTMSRFIPKKLKTKFGFL